MNKAREGFVCVYLGPAVKSHRVEASRPMGVVKVSDFGVTFGLVVEGLD
jgi:hypothetical protein